MHSNYGNSLSSSQVQHKARDDVPIEQLVASIVEQRVSRMEGMIGHLYERFAAQSTPSTPAVQSQPPPAPTPSPLTSLHSPVESITTMFSDFKGDKRIGNPKCMVPGQSLTSTVVTALYEQRVQNAFLMGKQQRQFEEIINRVIDQGL